MGGREEVGGNAEGVIDVREEDGNKNMKRKRK